MADVSAGSGIGVSDAVIELLSVKVVGTTMPSVH